MTGRVIHEALLFHGISPETIRLNNGWFVLLRGQPDARQIAVLKMNGARYHPRLKEWCIARQKYRLVKIVKALSDRSGYQLSFHHERKELERRLMLKGYSMATLRNYGYAFQQFREYFADREAGSVSVCFFLTAKTPRREDPRRTLLAFPCALASLRLNSPGMCSN